MSNYNITVNGKTSNHSTKKKSDDLLISYNDLADKPFEDIPTGGDTLTWDGNTQGLVSVGQEFYKISDATPSAEDLRNGWTICGFIPYNDTNVQDYGDFLIAGSDIETMLIVYTENADLDGMVVEKPGLYVMSSTAVYADEFGAYTLTIRGYTGFPSVKKLDSKYLPKADAIPDVSAAPTAEDFNALLASLRAAGYMK